MGETYAVLPGGYIQNYTGMRYWLLLLAAAIPAVLTYRCKVPGTFPSDRKCGEYYVCHSNLKMQVVRCPSGTWYDSSLSMCNLKRAVACKLDIRTTRKPWWRLWKRRADLA